MTTETSARLRDPIGFEVFRNAVTSLADEMAITVLRTAHSLVIADSMDFSTALCDHRGNVIAQGNCMPGHMGSFPDAMDALLAKFGGDLQPADVFILNDPDEGGMHLPDVFVMQPVFQGSDLIGFSVCLGHQADIGGRVPGGNAVDSTEIYQEGLQIPLLKLYDRGTLNETLTAILARNVRIPDLVLGDVMAEVNACRTGELGLRHLATRHGVAGFRALVDDLLDYSEQLTRARLSDLPDGEYMFEDYLDDAGPGTERVPIRVRLEVAGSDLHVDFTGTSPQVQYAINATASMTKSATYAAILAALGGDIPGNSGLYRPVRFTIPAGTVVNGRRPCARAARGIIGYRVVDAIFGALASVLPERIPAAGDGSPDALMVGTTDEAGHSTVLLDHLFGAWGARPDRDGLDGVSPLAGNLANTPIEELERSHTVRIQQYGYVQDSGGAGKWRGGLSVVRDHRLLKPSATLQIRSDRREYRPYGLAGGRPGGASWNIVDPGPDQTVLPSKITTTLQRGQVIRHVTAGGGGHGDPIERDPERVLQDVLDGKVSREAARREYGVAVREDRTLDAEATRQLRASRSNAGQQETSVEKSRRGRLS